MTENNNTSSPGSKAFIPSTTWYVGGLMLLFLFGFSYIFNEKIDLNGDNTTYYMLSTSIVDGKGYTDISDINCPPANFYPPGYPILMSVVRFFTDSIFLQKLLNGLFLLGSVVLIFFSLINFGIKKGLAFVASSATLLSSLVLSFSTMMMAEMSALFSAALGLFFLTKSNANTDKPFWRNRWFYAMTFAVGYGYLIRPQGIAFAAAVAGFYLFSKQWREMIAFVVGFVVCQLPWSIRNSMVGFESNRYIDMLTLANPWRPEEGRLGLGEYIGRFFDTFRMLLTKALPDSVLPYLRVDYGQPSTFIEWTMGILIVLFMVYGFVRFRKYTLLFLFYFLATFGVISLFSTPSQNRYLVALVPFVSVGLIVGFAEAISLLLRKANLPDKFLPMLLFVAIFILSIPRIEELRAMNKSPFPPNYTNFFAIGEAVKKQLPPDVVICSRKPNLFYMYSSGYVCGYTWTEDDKELLRSLITQKVDYVVLEQLGYSSTGRYLYPAIQKHPDLFQPVLHLPNPDTYLLKFDKEKAVAKLANQ